MQAIAGVQAATGDGGMERAPICGDIGVTMADARRIIRALAPLCGLRAHRLVEWSSADAPDTPTSSDLPPLYYATLLPDDARDEMPLGLGDTPAAALADLLWALGDPLLRAALRTDDPAPVDAPEASEAHALAGAP
jgi:hypothetical protein